MIGDALKSGTPTLRIELWAWLTERLPMCKYRKLMFCMAVFKTFCYDTETSYCLFCIQLCCFAQMVYVLLASYTAL